MDNQSDQSYLLSRRNSYRIPVAGADFDSELRVNQECYPVAVVDESAGGFGVVVEGPIPLQPNDSAWLHYRDGWTCVRVVHISPEESSAEPTDSAQLSAPGKLRLGLKRIAELQEPDDLPQSPWAAMCDLRAHMTWLFGSGLRTALGGVIFAVLVVGVPALVLGVMFAGGREKINKLAADSQLTENLAQARRRARGLSAPLFSAPRGGSAAGRQDNRRTSPAGRSNVARSSGSRSPGRGAARADLIPSSMLRTIRSLPGASGLTVPAVVRYLELSPEQQQHIAEIVEQTGAALKELENRFQTAGRQEMAHYQAMLFERARQQAEAVLEDWQKQRWQTLLGEADQSGSK